MQINNIEAIYKYASQRTSWETPAPREQYILSYQVCGRYDHTVGDEIISVGAGDVFFINRHDAYTVKCVEKGYAVCVNITGACDLPTRVWSAHDTPAFSLFSRLEKIKSVEKKSNYLLALSIIYEIFSICARLDEKSGDSAPDKIERAREYIAEHLCEGEILVSDLGKMCGISEKHFRTLFSRRYGTTPAQYIIDARMSMAQRLLSEGSFAVSEVSEMVGINDVYYFSRLFKKRFGTSPSSFRKKGT